MNRVTSLFSMSKIDDYISKLNKIDEAFIEQGILDIIIKHGNLLIDLNQGQLQQGVNSKGRQLKGYQSNAYAKFKNQLNSLPGLGTPDLKLTGAFYSGWYIQEDSFPITMNSSDVKTQELIEKYGKEIFGLDKDSLVTLREAVKPDIQELFKSILQL